MHFQLFGITTVFFLAQSLVSSFVTPPTSHYVAINYKRAPLVSIFPSLLLGSEIDVDTNSAPAGFEDAFADDIVLFDSTTQLFAIGFGVVIILGIAASFLSNQMDKAIELTLIEFEKTMKEKHQSRWVSMEAKLGGTVEPERSQRLFVIMEQLQESEPDFMARLNREMGS